MEAGENLDEMFELREAKRDLEAQVKDLTAKYKELEEATIAELIRLKLDAARGEMASASISRVVVPNPTDWTKIMAWITRYKRYDLFERRIAKAAWLETVQNRPKQAPIPGIESYEKISLNLRTR